MDCDRCGAGNLEELKLCSNCGAALPQRCGGCGYECSPSSRFCSQCGSALENAGLAISGAPALRPWRSSALPAAERREVTILFCDLVGSTALASRVDPEVLRQVMAAYHERIAVTVARFDGFVAHHLGDGAVVCFGWPMANEAAAERAVRAGLAVIDALGRAPVEGEMLQARVGIATGLVVVGNLLRGGAVLEQEVVGDTPNLAARLQAMAEPGTVVISHETRKQIGRLFACHDLGEVAVKGFSRAVRAWRVTGESPVRSRFEALRAGPLTAMVNREEELTSLLQHWRQAREGEARVILISGEPGIGKSRLLDALGDRLRGEAYVRLRYFCSQHTQDTPLHPVIAQLGHAAGFGTDESPEERLRKLEALLLPGTTPEETALFADLLAVSVLSRFPALNFSPQRKKEETFDALIRQLELVAATRPVLIIFEDAHWADPTSRELIDLMVRRIKALPVLLIMTFRPEFRVPWTDRLGVTLVTVGRLARPLARTIATQVGAATLAPELLDRIVAQSDGVPLFIEELTKSVVERGAAAPDTPPVVSIPQTLQASLMARLDRLPAAKEVAQCGAVIGREFSQALLAEVAPFPEAVRRQGLDQLVASGLVFRRGSPPDVRYVFKHALVQDAAYESLLRSSRSAIHSRIVTAIRRFTPDADAARPELLGHHCAQAGLIEQAVHYYQRAGDQSIARSAMEEARAHLEQGLRLLKLMPEGTTRSSLEAGLLLALGTVWVVTQGYGGAETGSTAERAVALSRGAGDKLLIRALFGAWAYRSHAGDLQGSLRAAEEMVVLADRQSDPLVSIEAATALGMNYAFAGRFVEARRLFENCLAKLGSERPLALEGSQPQDHEVLARSFLSLQLACLGYYGQSAAEATRAIERARKLQHQPSLAVALTVGCRQAWLIRDENLVATRAAELVTLCEEQRFPYWLARGRCYAGWVAAGQGRFGHGIALLNDALSFLRASGVALWNISGLIAEAYICASDAPKALYHVEEALRVSSRTGEVWADAELHRIKGEIVLMPSLRDGALAEKHFARAIEIARGHAAKLWELRAAVSLARLWSMSGKEAAARALLEPIVGWFGDARDAPDLGEAERLMRATNSVTASADAPPPDLAVSSAADGGLRIGPPQNDRY